MRDFDAQPYTEDEMRVVGYLLQVTNDQVGGGEDPIGFLISSHAELGELLKQSRRRNEKQ